MALEVEPFGRGSVARVQFTNTADREFPIEVRMYKGEISEEGELELVPADDEFLVFPSQMIVEPLQDQVIRVQYIGEPEINEAKVYYSSISELPIEMESGTPKVQITVRFNVFVAVEPDGVESVARADTITAAENEGQQGISVRVANDGKGMLLAGNHAWTITGKSKSGEDFVREFDAGEMGVVVGAGIVAPGKARLFFVPLDIEVDAGTVSIEIED